MTPEALKSYFLTLLQRRDYSEKELKDKANLKGYDQVLVAEIIADLKKLNFVNDLRLAENLLEYYKGRKGKNWLKQKLMLRKLDKSTLETVFDQSLQEVVPDLSLKTKIERKYNIENWSALDQNIKQKVARFLMSQGFSSPFSIMKKWLDEDLS